MKGVFAIWLLAFASAAWSEPLLVDNGRLFISAKVNGIATEALLDSGAEASLIDPALAAEARLPEGQAITIKGSGGSTAARFVEGVPIEVLGVQAKGEGVVVMDMTELSQRLIKRPTQAILGRELFDAVRLKIDLGGGTIDVVDRAQAPAGTKLPLTAHAGIESLPVIVNGIAAHAEFDLGNGSEPMVSRALVAKLGLEVLGKKAGGGIGGEIERDLVEIDRLELAGKEFRNVIATVDDQPSANDMNVGTSILRNFLITTDFSQRAVWLQPSSSGR
jgi:predicted aspartyl protease